MVDRGGDFKLPCSSNLKLVEGQYRHLLPQIVGYNSFLCVIEDSVVLKYQESDEVLYLGVHWTVPDNTSTSDH